MCSQVNISLIHLRGTPFLESLREVWLEFFQVELPKMEAPLTATVAEIWAQYLHEVRNHIIETAPDIVPYFDSTIKTLENIKTELCEKISALIKAISDSAPAMHPLFIVSLRGGLAPLFTDALRVTGKGHFTARQARLRESVSARKPHLSLSPSPPYPNTIPHPSKQQTS